MATEYTTVFTPLIDEARMAEYTADAFTITAHQNDAGVDIQFTPSEEDDRNVYMVAPGDVFFVPAGATVALTGGPEITAPPGRNVAVLHIVSTFDWAPILAATGQPIAEWWVLEGIETASFLSFVNAYDLAALASARNYASDGELRSDIMAGSASLNALLPDALPVAIGQLETADDDSVTMGVRTWSHTKAMLTEVEALNTLASVKQLAPELATHPVLVAALTDIGISDVTTHVRFVYWHPNESDAANESDKGTLEPVPQNSTIGLYKRTGSHQYALVNGAEGTADANGQVALQVARADLVLAAGESFVFRVALPTSKQFQPQYQHARKPRSPQAYLTWGVDNNAWVTFERSTTEEAIASLDFLTNLESTKLGSPDQPLEYYAGIPIFLQIQYPVVYANGAGASALFKQTLRKAPKGIKVEVISAGFTLSTFYTDEHGQIWGAIFTANETDTAIDIKIQYEIEDRSIGLLPIGGEVVEGGATHTSYTGNQDFYTQQAFLEPWKASVGKPLNISLATLQVGTVEIGGSAVSEFSSVAGRHAGILHALQQVRYMHQWFHHLTEGFTHGTNPDGSPKDESWAQILANHNNTRGKTDVGLPTQAEFDIFTPKIRVTTPRSVNPLTNAPVDPVTGITETNEGVQGEVGFVFDDVSIGNFRWWLTLYGYDAFRMDQQIQVPDASGNLVMVDLPGVDNKAQFWRVHTIWHEFTHAAINMVLEVIFNLDTYRSMTFAKDPSTSGRLNQVVFDATLPAVPPPNPPPPPYSGGWSVLEEGLAAVPEVALMKKATGKEPVFHPVAPAPGSPQYMYFDLDPAGNIDGNVNPATDRNLSQGRLINLNSFTAGAPLFDPRIGLRIPLAFTWALWSALEDPGGFSETLESHVTGPNPLNDLKDTVAYLQPAKLAQARKIFQALLWGPLVDMRPSQTPAPAPPQWNDLTGMANGPTTFSLMQTIEASFWNSLSATDKTKIKALFGNSNNPLSYYLWLSFP